MASEHAQKMYKETLDQEIRGKLFKKERFFLSRECHRQSLAFVIRACGGKVSWDSALFPCSKFSEDDETITFQVCDRPNVDKKYVTRKYVQPQFVYDCINAATVLPCDKYLIGAECPPHVCPFTRDVPGWYVPPEEDIMRRLKDATPTEKKKILEELAAEEELQESRIAASKAISEYEKEAEKEDEESDKGDEENEEEGGMEVNMDNEEKFLEKEEKKQVVRRGREKVVIEELEREKEEKKDERMRAMMIPKKSKNLYHKLKAKEKRFEEANLKLKERREAIEAHKMGKVSQEELDYPKKKKVKLNHAEKKKARYQQKLQKVKKFAFQEEKRRKEAVRKAAQ